MSEEEDKGNVNDGDNAAEADRQNSDSRPESEMLINGNENATPCQLDIGLGTHTDSRRHDNNSNVNGECDRDLVMRLLGFHDSGGF